MLPSAPRANVPVVVLEIVLSGSVSVCVIVMVARIGFPVTTLPPKPPINPPNSNMPAIGPPIPWPRPPNGPEAGGPCALTIMAAPASIIAAIPAPIVTLLTDLPPNTSRTITTIPIANDSCTHLLNQLHAARPAIFAHQDVGEDQIFIRSFRDWIAELRQRRPGQLDAHNHPRIVRRDCACEWNRHEIGSCVCSTHGSVRNFRVRYKCRLIERRAGKRFRFLRHPRLRGRIFSRRRRRWPFRASARRPQKNQQHCGRGSHAGPFQSAPPRCTLMMVPKCRDQQRLHSGGCLLFARALAHHFRSFRESGGVRHPLRTKFTMRGMFQGRLTHVHVQQFHAHKSVDDFVEFPAGHFTHAPPPDAPSSPWAHFELDGACPATSTALG